MLGECHEKRCDDSSDSRRNVIDTSVTSVVEEEMRFSIFDQVEKL